MGGRRADEKTRIDAELASRRAHLLPIVDRIGEHVDETYLRDKSFDSKCLEWNRAVFVIPQAILGTDFDPKHAYALESILMTEHDVTARYDPKTRSVRLEVPYEPDPVVLPVAEDIKGSLTPYWQFISFTDGAHVTEFDPTSAAKAKEILIMLRDADKRDRKNHEGGTFFLDTALRACWCIRDGDKDNNVVKQAIRDHIIPAELHDYTASDWGRWATHDVTDDEWPDRFMLYPRMPFSDRVPFLQ